MKKAVWVRIISIFLGVVIFAVTMKWYIINLYPIWWEFPEYEHSSFMEVVLDRIGMGILVSLLPALIPVAIGELILYNDKLLSKKPQLKALEQRIMKKVAAVGIRGILIFIGIIIFIEVMSPVIAHQYSLWQEFGKDKYLSFTDMLFTRCELTLLISLLLAAIPITVGEIVIRMIKRFKLKRKDKEHQTEK